ncbi:MAG: hypothetical protein NTZ50_14195 [Chloroflexi bacterium]|nr:hypothetical protein [Chloroflexota bacterium]
MTFGLLTAAHAHARVRIDGDAVFLPPTHIGVRVMRLTANGANSGVLCEVSPDEKSFGCGAAGYPFAVNPVTVTIESEYLLNVVPQEMPIGFSVIALEAQAAAARSFTYWYARRGTLINNSISYQAFIPGKFAALSNVTPDHADDPCRSGNLGIRQAKLCGAMKNPRYMTRADSDIPVFAQYSADWPNRTVTNEYHKALRAVDDPVSNTTNGACISDGTGSHGHGMSQNGANRWVRGFQCAYSARAPWSVKWETADQILFHYYTGIHLRAATQPQAEAGFLQRLLALFSSSGAVKPGDVVSPDWRWNPLRIDGVPSEIAAGTPLALNVQLQNTGVYTWTCTDASGCFSLGYVWSDAAGQVFTSTAWASLPCTVAPGDPSVQTQLKIADTPTGPAGIYTLTLDVRANTADGNLVWFSEQGWLAYSIPITLTASAGIEGHLPSAGAVAAGTPAAFVPFVGSQPMISTPETGTTPETGATPETTIMPTQPPALNIRCTP